MLIRKFNGIVAVLAGFGLIVGSAFTQSGGADGDYLTEEELYGDPVGSGDAGEIWDPIEPINRGVAKFNRQADRFAINPVLDAYTASVPAPLRDSLRNLLRHASMPMRLGNELLQGDLDGAGNVSARFFINTIAGAGGLADVARLEGYEYAPEDFGQTLGKWGVPAGPYLVVPLLGPTNLRDGAANIAESQLDPIDLWLDNTDRGEWRLTRTLAQYVTLRADSQDGLEALRRDSVDPYAALRSAYHQRRRSLIREEAAEEMEFPVYEEMPAPEPGAETLAPRDSAAPVNKTPGGAPQAPEKPGAADSTDSAATGPRPSQRWQLTARRSQQVRPKLLLPLGPQVSQIGRVRATIEAYERVRGQARRPSRHPRAASIPGAALIPGGDRR